MPFPQFLRGAAAAEPLSVSTAAEILAARQDYASRTLADLESRRAAYHAALSDGAMAAEELDSPAIERAQREFARAKERNDRATEAVQVAEAEHAKAVEREKHRALVTQWDAIEAEFAERHAAAAEYEALAAQLAEARVKYERAAADSYGAFPPALKCTPHYAVLAEGPNQAQNELERADVVRDWRRAVGAIKCPAITTITAGLQEMVRQARKQAGA
ncbi:MAG: hypothetical protein ACTHJG_00130 [Rhodanobacteraceae bacterium]